MGLGFGGQGGGTVFLAGGCGTGREDEIGTPKGTEFFPGNNGRRWKLDSLASMLGCPGVEGPRATFEVGRAGAGIVGARKNGGGFWLNRFANSLTMLMAYKRL